MAHSIQYKFKNIVWKCPVKFTKFRFYKKKKKFTQVQTSNEKIKIFYPIKNNGVPILCNPRYPERGALYFLLRCQTHLSPASSYSKLGLY